MNENSGGQYLTKIASFRIIWIVLTDSYLTYKKVYVHAVLLVVVADFIEVVHLTAHSFSWF